MNKVYADNKLLAFATLAIATAIFVVDAQTPLGVAGGVPYIAPVFLSYWFERSRSIFTVATICSFLTVLGFFISPPGNVIWMVIANRLLALSAIWITAILLARLKNSERNLKVEIVERQKTELEKIKSSSILESTFESTADGIIIFDNNNKIVQSNKKFQKMWRVPNSVLERRDRLEIVNFVKDQLKDEKEFMAKASGGQRSPKKGLNILEFKDGRIFEYYTQPQFINNENVGRVISFRDVTEKKQAEKALLESESKYRNLVESSPDLIYIFSSKRGGIYYSPRVAEVLGYPISHLLGNSLLWHNSIHPDDIEEVDKAICDYFKGAGYEIEYRIKNSRGEWKWFLDRFIRKEIHAGEIIIEGLATDITERKQAEEELGQTHELLTKTFASLEEAVFVVGIPSRKIISCNQAVEKIFGYSIEEVVGKSTEILHVSHEMFMRFGTELNSALNEKGVFKREFQIKRKNGEVFFSAHTVTEIKDDKGQRIAVVSVMRDITERKKAEELLKNRTIELEEANKELDEFNYVVTHDLKEPLRTLSNYTEILKRNAGENLDRRSLQAVDFINDATTQMRQMVNGLLQFSGVGREDRKMEAVDLNDCMFQVGRNLEAVIDETNGKLLWEKLPTVTGNPTMLTMALQNLVHNAFKFQADKPPEVVVSGLSINGKYEIIIADNGIGIDKDYFDQIFEPFKRLHSRSEYEGSGIGLAICRKIADYHGGEIKMESQKGIGSKFKLVLNQTKAPQTGETNRKDPKDAKSIKRKFFYSSIG